MASDRCWIPILSGNETFGQNNNNNNNNNTVFSVSNGSEFFISRSLPLGVNDYSAANKVRNVM
jgi:hypothetical protein